MVVWVGGTFGGKDGGVGYSLLRVLIDILFGIEWSHRGRFQHIWHEKDDIDFIHLR